MAVTFLLRRGGLLRFFISKGLIIAIDGFLDALLCFEYVRYLGYTECAEATKKNSGLTFTSLYTEAEIAMEMYNKALNNEIKVYVTDIEEYHLD